jgi:predicted TIM-barrel fold metal-dependent hydrolase
MIDFHAHLGIMWRESYPDNPPYDVHQLVNLMDRRGIDISVLLPLESPEGAWGYSLTEEVVAARDAYPARLIAFGCVDPRYPKALEFIDTFVERYGCKGFGEHVNGLAFDDTLNMRLYARCNELDLPLDFEIDKTQLCDDEVGLPRLERCLREFPNVKWCGHGPGFWSSISGDDDGRRGYPPGPVTPGGAIDRLMADYDNLYLDLSGGSGYNAMTRDPDFMLGFIERNWRRMLFGTDICGVHQRFPIIEWMRTVDVSDEVRQAVADGNARKLLGLDDG